MLNIYHTFTELNRDELEDDMSASERNGDIKKPRKKRNDAIYYSFSVFVALAVLFAPATIWFSYDYFSTYGFDGFSFEILF